MITDKDRAELKELTKQIRKSNQTMQWFDYGWDDCAEMVLGNGIWRLCANCAKLPAFAKMHYKTTEIKRSES